MKRKRIRITIKRGSDIETFTGHVLQETTVGYFAVHDYNDRGEWFARQSRAVNCREIES